MKGQYIGAILAAWTVFGTVRYTTDAGWRIPNSLQVMMPGIQLLLVMLLPESPRWLCSKDRSDEAFKVLVKVAQPPIVPVTQLTVSSIMHLETPMTGL